LGRMNKSYTSRYITQLPLASAKKATFRLFYEKNRNSRCRLSPPGDKSTKLTPAVLSFPNG
jgi:hypothetical protein